MRSEFRDMADKPSGHGIWSNKISKEKGGIKLESIIKEIERDLFFLWSEHKCQIESTKQSI